MSRFPIAIYEVHNQTECVHSRTWHPQIKSYCNCCTTCQCRPHKTFHSLLQHRWDDLLHQLFSCGKPDLRIASWHQRPQPWILHCTQYNVSFCNIKNKILQKPLLCYNILPIRVTTTIVFSVDTRVHLFPFLAFLFFSLCISGCHNFLISLHINSVVIHHMFHHRGRSMCRVFVKDTIPETSSRLRDSEALPFRHNWSGWCWMAQNTPLHQRLFLADATRKMPILKRFYDKVSKTCGCLVDEWVAHAKLPTPMQHATLLL